MAELFINIDENAVDRYQIEPIIKNTAKKINEYISKGEIINISISAGEKKM